MKANEPEQYILKSALVAEIEKCYNECLRRAKIIDSNYWYAKSDAYRNVLAILINTLEVKEVDLDKELNKYFITNNLIAADIQFEPVTQMKKCAKHFFELGVQVSNKAQKGE